MPPKGPPAENREVATTLPTVVKGTLLATEATATATQAGERAPSDPPGATKPPPT